MKTRPAVNLLPDGLFLFSGERRGRSSRTRNAGAYSHIWRNVTTRAQVRNSGRLLAHLARRSLAGASSQIPAIASQARRLPAFRAICSVFALKAGKFGHLRSSLASHSQRFAHWRKFPP